MAILESRASSNKLTVSERKIVGMLLKGALHYHRPPAIPTACGNLRFRESVGYLGVILQGGLKIDLHMTETGNKAKRLFHALARLGRTGMRIPGSKLHRPVQGALPEYLCLRSTWLGKKTQKTSQETAASGIDVGVDQPMPRPPPTVY